MRRSIAFALVSCLAAAAGCSSSGNGGGGGGGSCSTPPFFDAGCGSCIETACQASAQTACNQGNAFSTCYCSCLGREGSTEASCTMSCASSSCEMTVASCVESSLESQCASTCGTTGGGGGTGHDAGVICGTSGALTICDTNYGCNVTFTGSLTGTTPCAITITAPSAGSGGDISFQSSEPFYFAFQNPTLQTGTFSPSNTMLSSGTVSNPNMLTNPQGEAIGWAEVQPGMGTSNPAQGSFTMTITSLGSTPHGSGQVTLTPIQNSVNGTVTASITF